MPVLLLILLAGVVLYLAATRTSTLTRECCWRLDRSVGPGHYRCVACGAECDLPAGKVPHTCPARR